MPARPFAILLTLFLFSAPASGRDQREDARITALIQAVESLRDAKFVRNGSDYDAKAAADHLRYKLEKAGDSVKTAEDFIEGCASRSSLTGQKYLIRYADGKEVEAAAFLNAKLKEIDESRK